jgi:hypothetical protein
MRLRLAFALPESLQGPLPGVRPGVDGLALGPRSPHGLDQA